MSKRSLAIAAADASASVLPDPYFKNVSLLISGDGTNGSQNNTFVDDSGNIPASAAIKYAKIYSTYSGGTRGASYTVQYSDDGSNWNTAWTGTMTSSACGLITGTGGGGSYGTHKYWRYVVGGATASHHPRCSRIVLSTDTVDYDIYIYTTDNCADSGGIPSQDSVFPYTFGVTRNGNLTQGTFSPYGSNWSVYFPGGNWNANGTNVWNSLEIANNAALQLTGDFTIELYCYLTSSQVNILISNSVVDEGTGNNVGWYLYVNTDSKIYFEHGGSQYITPASVSIYNKWAHIALTRSGSTTRLFVDGTEVGSTTGAVDMVAATNVRSDTPWMIGCLEHYYWNGCAGYISNVRVVKGTALYTSNFTPSTEPLTAVSGTSLLTCQSNRLVDNSPNNFTVSVYNASGSPSVQRFGPFNPTAPYSAATIGGSGYFDGSGDYLSIPYSTNYCSFGTGDFTIECFVYEITHVNYTAFISSAGSGVAGWFFGYSNSQKLCFFADGTFYLECDLQKLNRWSHVAVTRQSGTLRMYIDGVLQGSTTYSSSIPSDSTHAAVVGKRWTDTAEYFWNGYIANIRILKGTALYTGSTYTVPTAPLTAISNTQLLLSNTNAGIPDAAMMNDLETVGNAQVSTSVKKYGTGSLYFDGNDGIKIPFNHEVFNFGTGDWTIEFWCYHTQLNSYNAFIGAYTAGGTSNSCIVLGSSSTGEMYVTVTGANVQITTAPNTFTTNQWYHVAVVRYGLGSNNITAYVNGVSKGTYTYAGPNQLYFNAGVGVGQNLAGSFTGYLDDVRVTKGLARYTTNFTPPAQALPTN